jgi:hypothetical protein
MSLWDHPLKVAIFSLFSVETKKSLTNRVLPEPASPKIKTVVPFPALA